MSSFTLNILGSASAKPTVSRNPSAQVLDVQGRLFLIDCGEAAQMQMVRMGISPLRIEAAFISHLHGDHLFGLFGLLATMGMLGRTKPLKIFAPEGFAEILDFYLAHFSGGDTYEIEFTPLAEELCTDGMPAYMKCGAEFLGKDEGVKDHLHITGPEKILDAGTVEVFAFPLQHRVPCFGYLFREKEKELNIYKEAIAKYDLSVEEIKTLKAGHDVVRTGAADSGDSSSDSGRTVISVAEATYMPPRPRSFAYCSDTREFPELAGWVRGVDLMYHEATFSKEMTEQAAAVFHSTTEQAARCAKDACAGKLVVGHYSSRFSDVSFFLDELRAVFPNSFLAFDGNVIEI